MAATLGLGTVQFGMRYGVSNQDGKVLAEEARAILVDAAAAGCSVLDTAHHYGDSEAVLGRCAATRQFRVVTKTPQFEPQELDAKAAAALRSAFERSLDQLAAKQVYGLLAHSADDLLKPGGDRLWAEMQSLKAEGSVQRIGASIHAGTQAVALLERYRLDLIQVPLNIFDQRLLRSGILSDLRRSGVEIHARSAFLQGLLLMPPGKAPVWFDPIRPLLRKFHASAVERNLSPLVAALTFVRDHGDVDAIVVGVTGRQQFAECLAAFRSSSSFDGEGFACDDPRFVNPALWRLA